MVKSDFSNPFDVWYPWYYPDCVKQNIVIEGNNMTDPKRAYDGTQCKSMVHPEDGSKAYRCRLGVWKTYPDDGYCFMHHPKVDLRGGAAQKAIMEGELKPKTKQARERLTLKGKPRKRMGRPPKKREILGTDNGFCTVEFIEHKVTAMGAEEPIKGKVAFSNTAVAKAYCDTLSDVTPLQPLQTQDSASFYTDVKLSQEMD